MKAGAWFALISLPVSLVGRDCGLTIAVFGDADKELAYRVTSFVDPKGMDVSKRFVGLHVDGLPCGTTFTYEIVRSDIKVPRGIFSSKLVVEDSQQWLTLQADRNLTFNPDGTAFANDGARPTDYFLRGLVKGFNPTGGPARIRFATVSTGKFREVAVANDGSFEVFSPLPDAYIVTVLQSGHIIADTYLVVTPRNEPKALELKASSSVQ